MRLRMISLGGLKMQPVVSTVSAAVAGAASSEVVGAAASAAVSAAVSLQSV